MSIGIGSNKYGVYVAFYEGEAGMWGLGRKNASQDGMDGTGSG